MMRKCPSPGDHVNHALHGDGKVISRERRVHGVLILVAFPDGLDGEKRRMRFTWYSAKKWFSPLQSKRKQASS